MFPSITAEGALHGKDGPRAFLGDLSGEKTTCVPVEDFIPTAVPDFSAQDSGLRR